MMRPFRISEIAAACAVRDDNTSVFRGAVRIDSRLVQSGDIFVALRGDRFDGHDFIGDVERAGAVVAIVEHEDSGSGMTQWLVRDTTRILGELAAFNRNAFSGPVIGVTGSVGKTTTKEMIAAILAQNGSPLVTTGNLNNHLGVPLTLLQLSAGHDCAVVEMGASALGEIRYLTKLVKPLVALVTAVAPAHVEGFGSIDNVAIGKAEIFEGLQEGGTAIINLDNRYTAPWAAQLAEKFQVLRYSASETEHATLPDVYAKDIRQDRDGIFFRLHYREESAPVSLSFLGIHNVGNAVAAAACCFAIGMSMTDVVAGLKQARPYKGRLALRQGFNDCCIIDDSYNANPASVRMAIAALMAMPLSNRILVLGDMAELGAEAESMHFEIGVNARQAGVTTLLACGDLSRAAVQGFGEGAQHFPDHVTLIDACLELTNPQTTFLVKGSRSAEMDRVVDGLTTTLLQEETVMTIDQVNKQKRGRQ